MSDHALSLAMTPVTGSASSTSAPAAGSVVVKRVGITETGLEGALFGLLDRDIDRRLCSNVQDTLVSLLQALAVNTLSRWLILIKDVLQASDHSVYYQKYQYIVFDIAISYYVCLLYTSPSPRDRQKSRMPSSA